MTDPTNKLPTLAEVIQPLINKADEEFHTACGENETGWLVRMESLVEARDLAIPYDALIASQAEEIARLTKALEEREGDMHLRIRAGYDKTVADTWRALVAEKDAEIARLTAENAELQKLLGAMLP